MLIKEHTLETELKEESIWRVWEDVKNWNLWDSGIEYSSIEGPFQAGTQGILKPRGGPVIRTKLTVVKPMNVFVDEATLKGAKILMTHFLTRVGSKLTITHRIEMKGPLSIFYAFVIGRDMRKNLPHEMMELVKKAEAFERAT
ncbi:MAG: hypothetical protein ChlgKO_12040 [Chlamydiales bacterium]